MDRICYKPGRCAPDDEVYAVIDDLERPIGTYLYGRRMYEAMVLWEARFRPRSHQTAEGVPARDITVGGAQLAGEALSPRAGR